MAAVTPIVLIRTVAPIVKRMSAGNIPRTVAVLVRRMSGG